MELIVSFIGLSQSLFAIVLMLTKRPLKIADYILCMFFLSFVFVFGLDIMSYYGVIVPNRWFISLGLWFLLSPLIFLYSKYITKDYSKFEKTDLLHFIPTATLLLLFIVLRYLPENNVMGISDFYQKYKTLKIYSGFVFNILVVYYVAKSIYVVLQYKKRSVYYYSYKSYKINLDWLLFMILFYLFIILLIIISSALYETGRINFKVYLFRHIVELIHICVLSIWGFHQRQLNTFEYVDIPENTDEKTTNTGKYTKSGLKKNEATIYIEKLHAYIETSQAWKDPELSIGKLAIVLDIPKHQLSELLNEYLGKSFYNLINEYRVESAKKLLLDEAYANWSILAIAFECGFNSKSAFNSFFKKVTEQTPSEYRKIELGQQN